MRKVNHQMPDFPATIGPLCDPEDKGPNLSFQGRDRRPRSRSWLHLDLYTADQQAEVERLVGLGARRYPWRYRARDPHCPLRARLHLAIAVLAEAHSEEPAQPKPESPCRSDGANPVPYSNRRPVLPPILGRRRLRRIADSGKGRPGRDKGRLRKSRGRCPTTIIDALKADHGRRRIAPFKRRSSKNRMRKNSSTAGKMAC